MECDATKLFFFAFASNTRSTLWIKHAVKCPHCERVNVTNHHSPSSNKSHCVCVCVRERVRTRISPVLCDVVGCASVCAHIHSQSLTYRSIRSCLCMADVRYIRDKRHWVCICWSCWAFWAAPHTTQTTKSSKFMFFSFCIKVHRLPHDIH